LKKNGTLEKNLVEIKKLTKKSKVSSADKAKLGVL
jgi:hypothetical protein